MRSVLVALASLLSTASLSACTPFPRKASVDNTGGATSALTLAAVDPALTDAAAPQWQFNNDNGIAEPGETVQLTALLSWSGPDARTITVAAAPSVATDSCVASVQSRVASLPLPGVMTPTTVSVTPLEVRLQAQSCSAGTAQFDLQLTIVETDEMVVMPIVFPVSDRDGMMSLSNVSINDGATGDGALSPGETSTLTLDVKNEGVSTLRNVGVAIAGTGTCVASSNSGTSGRLVNYGDVFAGQTVTLGGTTLSVTADSACAAGDSLKMTFIVEDASGDQFQLPYSTKLK